MTRIATAPVFACVLAQNVGLPDSVFHRDYGLSKFPADQIDGSYAADGSDAVLKYVLPLLGEPRALRHYLAQPWALPPAP